jgi:AraC-like DNA-binding protein
MKWITRERPKIDRIACPWLIKRFVDKDAEFFYVPFNEVLDRSRELDAIPFDVPDVELTHTGPYCTFDAILKKYNLRDEALAVLAPIVRGADTDHHELAAECAGLWAIAAGMSKNMLDDQELLESGMVIYDALYTWAKHLQGVRHTQQPFENLLLDVFNRYLKAPPGGRKKIPEWARELKEIIQDQIDTNITLKEVSKNLDISPSYLSREFSKYFEDLSFGEYIRRQRIEKAQELMKDRAYSLTEIAYLTGFSDQSHFTRIFQKYRGESPSVFRKKMLRK